ncbi:MAG: hypothetical protein ACI9SQ_002164, partial [Rubritalea sp.]
HIKHGELDAKSRKKARFIVFYCLFLITYNI